MSDDDSLEEEEFSELNEILTDAESSTRLTDWEASFCDDMRERVLQYGDRTRVSDRQWEVLQRIAGKMHG